MSVMDGKRVHADDNSNMLEANRGFLMVRFYKMCRFGDAFLGTVDYTRSTEFISLRL